MRLSMTRLGLIGIAATAFLSAEAANAQTVALVTINQQALFFNQINDGAKQAADKAAVSLSSSTPTTSPRLRTAQSRTISPRKSTASCSSPLT